MLGCLPWKTRRVLSSEKRYEGRTDANGSDGEGSYIGVNLGPPAVGSQKENLAEVEA